MEGMSGERMSEIVYDSEVEGRWDRNTPSTKWADGVELACCARSMQLEVARAMCMGGEQGWEFLNGTHDGMND